MIELSLIGDCAVRVGDTRLTPDAERLFALVLYLAVGRGRRHPRRALQELLWPDAPERSAAHNLRQALYKLKQLGVPWRAAGDAIELAEEEVHPDALARLDAGEAAEEVLSLAPGDYLEGYAPGFSAGFAEWVEEQRGSAHARIVRGLLVLLARCRSQGRWTDMDVVARACLRLDPLHEEATLARAEAAAMGGSKARALSILDRYLEDVGPEAAARIQLPVSLLRRRIAERQAPRYPAPGDSCFVGREASMAFVTAALADARAGRGRAALVWGSPGIGKTRLGMEVAGLAALQGAQPFTITCYEREVGRPLAAFVNFTGGLLGLRGALGCSEESMGYLRRLTELPGEQPPEAEPPDAATLHAAVRQSVVDLVEAIAEEAPLLLIIDDAQWLDPVSSAVLRTIALGAARRRLLLLFLTRTPQVGVPGEADGVTERHQLLPLEDAAAEALARAMTGQAVPAPGDRLISWWVRTAGGSPFFLRELAAQWLETGREYVVPPTVGAVVEDRLARLDATALRVLQTCAALGHSGTVERLASVLGHPSYVMLDAVTTLERTGFVIVSSAGLLQRHALGGDRALALLGEGSRRLLHRSCAQAIEAEIRMRPSAALAWECAEQWERADEPRRALDVVLSCGRQLLSVGLPADALETFGRGLVYCRSERERVECLAGYADAAEALGDWSRFAATAASLRELTNGSNSHREFDDLELRMIRADWRLGTCSRQLLERAEAIVDDVNRPPSVRVHSATLALCLADNLCDYEAVRRVHARIAHLVATPSVDLRATLHFLLLFNATSGSLDEAVSAATRLVDIDRESTRDLALVDSLCHAARVHALMGDTNTQTCLLLEAFHIASQRSLQHRALRCAGQLAWAYYAQAEDYEQSEYWVRQFLSIQSPFDDWEATRAIASLRAKLALRRGSPEEARSIFQPSHHDLFEDVELIRRLDRQATRLRIAMANGERPSPELVYCFEETFRRVGPASGRDYAAYTLYLLNQENGPQHTASISPLHEYVSRRRERGPASSEIRAALA